MKIALIIIAYIILGICTTLAYLFIDYKTEYSHASLEEYYHCIVEDAEILYLLILLFWPIYVLALIILFGGKYFVRLCIHILKYITGGSDEEEK